VTVSTATLRVADDDDEMCRTETTTTTKPKEEEENLPQKFSNQNRII
jgi:hypothetical protein